MLVLGTSVSSDPMCHLLDSISVLCALVITCGFLIKTAASLHAVYKKYTLPASAILTVRLLLLGIY